MAAAGTTTQPIAVELIAVLVAVADGSPLAMTIDNGRALPSGRSRSSIARCRAVCAPGSSGRRDIPLGYVEQLYTFADSDRRAAADGVAGDLDQLSRPHARGTVGGSASGVADLVRLFSLGGPSRRPPADDRKVDCARTDALGRERKRSGKPRLARRHRLRARRAALERGARAPALRAPLRSRTHRRSAPQDAGT